MDVIKLDPVTYVGKQLVRGWTNMIWTERFLPAGQFEMRTPLVDYTRALIPEDSLISLRDSKEIAQVEDLEIETDDDGIDILKVTGRTWEAPLLESRNLTMGIYREPFRTQPDFTSDPAAGGIGVGYTPTEAAGMVAWDMLCNPYTWSRLRPSYGNNPNNVIPNLDMSLTEHVDEVNQYWWLENGPAYPIVTDFLVRDGAGVRNIRPPFNLQGPATDAFSGFSEDGTISRYPTTGSYVSTRAHMNFYKGLDRSIGQSARPAVIFDYQKGDLKSQRYLFSNKNLKNIAEVKSKVGDITVYAEDVYTPYLTGRNRRYLYVDGGDPGDIALETFLTGLVQKGEIELAKYNRIAAMEGGVQPTAPHKYGRDYFLGDKVTLRGNYGFNQKMEVSEYVRTSNGIVEEGYPTLTISS